MLFILPLIQWFAMGMGYGIDVHFNLSYSITVS